MTSGLRCLPIIALVCALLATGVSANHQRQLSSCANSCSNVLSSAGAYGALAYSTVTNVGSSIVTGDVGVYPGSSVTGFPPATATHIWTNAGSQNTAGQSDANIAYSYLKSLPTSGGPIGKELGGVTVYPGVYFFAENAHLAGNLTFDAGGNNSATFVFQVSTTFVVEIGSRVILLNGAQACNVFYQVGNSVTVYATASLRGSVVAYTEVILGHATSVTGSLISITTAVTLDDNIVNVPTQCVDV